jgi:hypothetical protein
MVARAGQTLRASSGAQSSSFRMADLLAAQGGMAAGGAEIPAGDAAAGVPGAL